jgi:methylmalonyl-CoA/ethylmalonyl-CoA epimerase
MMPWLAWNFISEQKAHGVLIELATRYQTVGDKWMPRPDNAENGALRDELTQRYY